MTDQTSASRLAAAHALALIVSANGRIDPRELAMLDELDAFARLGVSRQQFVELAQLSLLRIGAQLAERKRLRPADRRLIEELLAAVAEPELRLLVCRLAAAVVTADGRVSSDERLVYGHMMARWRISDAMVTQAILADRRRRATFLR